MEQFDFGRAIDELRKGNKVQRAGWNGKGMYVVHEPSYYLDDVLINEYLLIKNVNGSMSIWVPSINDVFASDWQFV